MLDLSFAEYHREISNYHPNFCPGVTVGLLRLVHDIPVSGRWHAFAGVYDPAAAFLWDRMREYGAAEGAPSENSMESNPRVFFVRRLHRVLGVAYNVPPMVHHGTDTEAKEGMLNLLYSIYHSMLGRETARPPGGGRLLDVSPPGTRNQIFFSLKAQKYCFPPRPFAPGVGQGEYCEDC
jgi:hypothetical protein